MSELQQIETELNEQLDTFETPQEGADILVSLGLTHMRMHEFRRAADEIWGGMHGRTGMQNLGTLAVVGGYFLNSGIDQATRGHFNTLHDQNSK
ncbi:hypothetical protein EOL96_04910 [Candidatus Saccharibacteria bacterium]|nr:hypothetical protein [Candidatus Saccharibacteria bacterium]